MKERPVLFNGDMVRAILDGRKTQTRRVIKPSVLNLFNVASNVGECSPLTMGDPVDPRSQSYYGEFSPFGQVGDRLWVRETFGDCGSRLVYRADSNDGASCSVKRWVPSIHMPRSACRLVLEITNVRVERLNSISEEDALAEGIRRTDNNFGNGPAYCDYMLANLNDVAEWYNRPSDSFISLWQSIYGAESWQHSPWVWVIEFKVVRDGN